MGKDKNTDEKNLEVMLEETEKKFLYAQNKIDKLNKKIDELQDKLDWECGRGIYSSNPDPFNERFSHHGRL